MVDQLLCRVSVPNILFSVSSDNTPFFVIVNALENYYNSVMSCVRLAGVDCLPNKCYNVHDDHIFPG